MVSNYVLLSYTDVNKITSKNLAADAGGIDTGHSATFQLRWEDPDTHQVAEINGNFNTWDLAESFESADPRFQLAVIVAQYADMLRRSPWAAETYASQLVEHAYRVSSLLWDDTEVTAFASLVSRASQIRALGN